MADPYEIPCRVLVEMLTDYIEGALDPADTERVEAHLSICPPCVHVLEQFRQTIALTGELSERDVEGLDAEVRASLLDAFGSVHRRS